MDIKNARDLSKIITLCRKKGVQTIKVSQDGSIELTLLEAAPARQRKSSKTKDEKADESADGYTDEEILMWSSGGLPSPIPTEEN